MKVSDTLTLISRIDKTLLEKTSLEKVAPGWVLISDGSQVIITNGDIVIVGYETDFLRASRIDKDLLVNSKINKTLLNLNRIDKTLLSKSSIVKDFMFENRIDKTLLRHSLMSKTFVVDTIKDDMFLIENRISKFLALDSPITKTEVF